MMDEKLEEDETTLKPLAMMGPLTMFEGVKVDEATLETLVMVERRDETTLEQMKMDGAMAKVVYTKVEPLPMVEAFEMNEPPGKWMGSQERWLEPQWRR